MYIFLPRAYIAYQRVAERPLRSYCSVAHLVTIILEKTQERMYEAGIRHPTIPQPKARQTSPARSPSQSRIKRKINDQPNSIIDLT